MESDTVHISPDGDVFFWAMGEEEEPDTKLMAPPAGYHWETCYIKRLVKDDD